ncbi:MAG: SMC-Scp complex subunit ScpB [Oscillospiraceae bacterium]
MEINRYIGIIEACLFASGQPLEAGKIAEGLELELETVIRIIRMIKDKYNYNESGIKLLQVGDGYQFCTNSDYADSVIKVLDVKRNAPLSNAAMEVLAIIAYNQPVTKSFIEQVRGVESSQIVNNLVEKELVEEAGRLDLPGRPISYKTSPNFLRCFGLTDLSKLPSLPNDDNQVGFDDVLNEKGE